MIGGFIIRLKIKSLITRHVSVYIKDDKLRSECIEGLTTISMEIIEDIGLIKFMQIFKSFVSNNIT